MPSIIRLSGYAGTPIRSFADWAAHAMPPERRAKHWKEGRSAFEIGRNWTQEGQPSVPVELRRLLDSHGATLGAQIQEGITEHETALPFGSRGPRCHDLALFGTHHGSSIVICIEAKADESFGGTAEEELAKARKRPSTRFPDRLNWLTTSLLGMPAFSDAEFANLSAEVAAVPYQLLSAVGGTMLEAAKRKSSKAVLVIHEFRTPLTADAKMKANAVALDNFIRLLQRCNQSEDQSRLSLRHEQLLGPVHILKRQMAGTESFPSHLALFLGKIRTDLLS